MGETAAVTDHDAVGRQLVGVRKRPREGSIDGRHKPEQLLNLVCPGELNLVPDQEGLQVLLGALLRVKTDRADDGGTLREKHLRGLEVLFGPGAPV